MFKSTINNHSAYSSDLPWTKGGQWGETMLCDQKRLVAMLVRLRHSKFAMAVTAQHSAQMWFLFKRPISKYFGRILGLPKLGL
jgi:hypothetical protein